MDPDKDKAYNLSLQSPCSPQFSAICRRAFFVRSKQSQIIRVELRTNVWVNSGAP